MTKNLVIVESPAKAKTIEKYLGKEYTVKSSFGHIRDLPKKGIGVDVKKEFEPTYEISPDKKKVVSELRKAAKAADTIWLASDEDREGEAISWHLCEALKLDPVTTKRIVFHEITKPAILHAIENPRTVDKHLVDAQQARRILDRLVGYELSPVLWKKVQRGLSAGRVQSVAVRLIVEREREIQAHESTSSFKITAIFTANGQELPAELSVRFDKVEDAQDYLQKSLGAEFKVANIEKKPGVRNPGAPFTTSTLQQEASRRLGYSVKQTMQLAQRLYESGRITYMRTDSTNLAGQAIAAAGDYIKSTYGEQYHQVRQFKTKNESAQEAHEAIRPTDFRVIEAGNDAQQIKLYQLIWQRALASQMAPAKVDKTEVRIQKTESGSQNMASKNPTSGIRNPDSYFIAKGEVLLFDGFLKVYGGGKDDVILPDVSQGQVLPLQSMTGTEVFSKPPARYSEASLVKALEEMGIGRPSTYAPTISTIQDRGYIEKRELEGIKRMVRILETKDNAVSLREEEVTTGADRGKLLPTHLAEMVTDFLVAHFSDVVDYDFTAKAEAQFDDIADGKQSWQDMLKDFYKLFHPLVEKSESVSRSEASQMRELGQDPKTKRTVYARYGRYGPMLQIGVAEDEEKPVFAPLPEGTTLDTVTLEQGLKMFDLPRVVGKTEDGQDIEANIGRFGPYVKVGKLFVSIKPLDPLSISLEEAQRLIKEKQEREANRIIQEFEGTKIQVLNGQYGPYITDGKKNAKIPKDTDPKSLTLEQCKKMLEEAPAKKFRRFKKK